VKSGMWSQKRAGSRGRVHGSPRSRALRGRSRAGRGPHRGTERTAPLHAEPQPVRRVRRDGSRVPRPRGSSCSRTLRAEPGRSQFRGKPRRLRPGSPPAARRRAFPGAALRSEPADSPQSFPASAVRRQRIARAALDRPWER
jgi:hypothetical protein